MLQVRVNLNFLVVFLNNKVFFSQKFLNFYFKSFSKKTYYFSFFYKSLLKFGLVSPFK